MTDIVTTSDGSAAPQAVSVPATPVSSAYDVTDIPTITLPLTKATKAHVSGVIAAVSGAAQISVQVLPPSDVTAYISAALAVLTIGAVWLGVYSVPNIPKIVKR